MLKETRPTASEGELRHSDGWHQPKHHPKSATVLYEAQAQQTYIMEHERTAQLTEPRGFFSGFLEGGRSTFLITVMIGGVSMLVWKVYQNERRSL